jgi:DNA-binding MarR family transcriptional regulator
MTRLAATDVEPAACAEPAIGWLFGIASKMVAAAAFRVVDQYAISPAGLGVLTILSTEDGLRSTDVASRIGCTPATLTSVASTLERAGYLRRQVSPADRRVVELHITAKGRHHADLVRRRLDRWYHEMFDFLSPEDEQVVRPFLNQTIARLGH